MTVTRREVLLSVAGSATAWVVPDTPIRAAQPVPDAGTSDESFALMRERQAVWLHRAQALMPTLNATTQKPISLVQAQADASLPLRYRMERLEAADALEGRLWHKGDQFILDFGGHRTGHLSFDLEGEGRGVDAPVRLRLTFGEVPTDVAEPLYPYKGALATGWLPDDVINVDYLPQSVHLPRRYAFRYVKVEIIDTSSTFAVRFHNVQAVALTSATSIHTPLNSSDELLNRIDAVGIATLRDCMQTVFEDGPRRDQRLWVGDLRLQALAAYATFGGHALVKRCLYLFAAFPRVEDGLIGACVYEKPSPRYGGIHILDYAAMFNAALFDYVKASGDVDTGNDLWPVALRQSQLLRRHVGPDGLFVDSKDIWLFIDWNEKLDRTASVQGALIYAFERTLALARLLHREWEVRDLERFLTQMRTVARDRLFDRRLGVFVSGPARQVSWASQAWLSLAGVGSESQRGSAIRRAMQMSAAIRPTTPYLYHHVVDGLLTAGMSREALRLVKSYWGGMIAAGADTFWEVYDPEHPLSSPYGDIHINSFCHAWSCTPTYFFRARGLAGHLLQADNSKSAQSPDPAV